MHRNTTDGCLTTRLDVYHALVTFDLSHQTNLKGLVKSATLAITTPALPPGDAAIFDVDVSPLNHGSHQWWTAEPQLNAYQRVGEARWPRDGHRLPDFGRRAASSITTSPRNRGFASRSHSGHRIGVTPRVVAGHVSAASSFQKWNGLAAEGLRDRTHRLLRCRGGTRNPSSLPSRGDSIWRKKVTERKVTCESSLML